MMTSALPFESKSPNDYKWTSLAYDMAVAGRLVVEIIDRRGVRTLEVEGPCPRCNESVDFSMTLDMVAGEQPGTLGNSQNPGSESDQFAAFTVTCQCSGNHPGRPDPLRRGCGINFRVEVKVN